MRWLTTAMLGAFITLAPISAHADNEADVDEVKVHVIGEPELVLERNIPDTQLWEMLCDGPCDTNVPREGSYRIAGRGVRPSLPITLDVAARRVARIEAHAAYATGWVGGVLLTTFGPLAIIGGAFALGIGLSQNDSIAPCPFDVPCNTPIQQNHVATIGGALTLGVGAIMTVAGIYAIVSGDHTKTRQLATFTARGVSIAF